MNGDVYIELLAEYYVQCMSLNTCAHTREHNVLGYNVL